MEAGRYEVKIDGIKGDAKGMRSQACVETTITGVKWTFTGELAVALLRALGEAQCASEGDGTHPNQTGAWL